MRIGLAVALASLTVASLADAQPAPAPADRNLTVQWLLLKRAYLDVRDSEEALAQADNDKSALPAATLRSAVERAHLEYGAVLASFVPVIPRLVVTSAVKQRRAGRSILEIGVRSQPLDWSETLSRLALPALEADFKSLATIRSALVMLKSDTGTVIGHPFQATIDMLKPGEQTTVRFEVQDAITTLVVAMNYAGHVEDYSVRVAAGGPQLRLDAVQMSQDADLGSTATYDLRIERTTADARVLRLQAVGLPSRFRHEFLFDTKPGATRISQYRFPDDELTRPIVLRVQLPDAIDDRAVALDTPIRFRARVVDAASQDGDRAVVSAEAQLELVPRGVGHVALQSPSFLIEGTEGSSIATRVEVKNTGSRDVNDIKPAIDVPTGWTATVTPAVVTALGVNASRTLEVLLQPGGARAGDYTVKVRAGSSEASHETPATADLRVRIVGRASIGGMVGFFGGLLVLVVAITYAGARLARR